MMNSASPLVKPKTSRMAIWSLVLSFIPIIGIVGLILGIVFVAKNGKRKKELSGAGLAVAGMVIGCLNTLASCLILPILLAFALPSIYPVSVQAKEDGVIATADSVQVAVEKYKAEHNGERPKSFRDFEASFESFGVWRRNPLNRRQSYSLDGGGLVDGEPAKPGQIGYIAPKSPTEPYEIVAKLSVKDYRLTEQLSDQGP